MKHLAVPLVVAFFLGAGIGPAVAADSHPVKGGKPAAAQARVVTDVELIQELRSHRERPVVLHFWATWCGPCLSELPNVAELAQDAQRRGIDFVAVSLDDPSARGTQHVSAVLAQRVRDPHWSRVLRVTDIERFVASIDPSWEGEIPAFFAFGHDAKLRRMHLGDITRGEFEGLIAGLVAAEKP